MPKSAVAGVARTRARRSIERRNAVEGQIAEICRDLAVQVKRGDFIAKNKTDRTVEIAMK